MRVIYYDIRPKILEPFKTYLKQSPTYNLKLFIRNAKIVFALALLVIRSFDFSSLQPHLIGIEDNSTERTLKFATYDQLKLHTMPDKFCLAINFRVVTTIRKMAKIPQWCSFVSLRWSHDRYVVTVKMNQIARSNCSSFLVG